MFIAGRRSYARVVYPEALRIGPPGPAGGSFIQTGFDAPLDTVAYGVTAGFSAVLARNLALNPLQVQLPNVTPGNILVVDFSGIAGHVTETIDAPNSFLPVVSFNGVTAYAPGVGFFHIINAVGLGFRANGSGGIMQGTIRCYGAVIIPPGATTATVQVAFTSASNFLIPGQDFPDSASAALSATELLASAVTQTADLLAAY